MFRQAMLAVALLLAPAARAQEPPAAPEAYAGFYEGGQMEIAAALELLDDGRFHFAMIYGALDEHAEGSWAAEAGGVRLTPEVFVSNDPGGGSFPPVLLRKEGGALLLDRHGRQLRFQPQR